ALVGQVDSGAEDDAAAGIEPSDVDDLGVAQRAFELLDAAFGEPLLFARRVVFRVLAQIAVCTGFGDGGDDAWTIQRLQLLELRTQPLCALRRHWRPFHASSLCNC